MMVLHVPTPLNLFRNGFVHFIELDSFQEFGIIFAFILCQLLDPDELVFPKITANNIWVSFHPPKQSL